MEGQNTATLAPSDCHEDVKTPLLTSVNDMIEENIGRGLNMTQFVQIFITSLSPLFDSFQTFMSIFVHAQPTWHCTMTTNSNGNSNSNSNYTCSSNVSDLCRLSRDQWVWDYANTSIISEWNLECASSFISGFPDTCYFMGCLLGGLVLAAVGDSSLGRKNLLCFSSLLMSLAALASAFVSNIWVYSVCRFVCGVGRAPLAMCALVLLSEKVGKQWRSLAVMVASIFISLGLLILIAIAYLAKESSWRYVYLWTSIPGIIFSILAYFFIYESPRWLLMQGREKDAMDIYTRLVGPTTSNGISTLSFPTTNETATQTLSATSTANPFASFKVLISQKWAAKRLVASMLLNFGIGLMYFGMFLGVGDLGANIYTTSIYHVLLAVSSSLLAFLYWIPNCNRRSSMLGFCTLSGVTSMIFTIVCTGPAQGVVLGIELASIFFTCMAFNIYLMYVIELFPSCVRSCASSLIRQAMILGSVFDPMLILLGRGNLVYSQGILGSVILISGFLVIGLPETRGKVLCDAMEEQELRDKEKVYSKFFVI